jgi:hypothetical protein
MLIWPTTLLLAMGVLAASPLWMWKITFAALLLFSIVVVFVWPPVGRSRLLSWLTPAGLAFAVTLLPFALQTTWSVWRMHHLAEAHGLNCINRQPLLTSVREGLHEDAIHRHFHATALKDRVPWIWSYRDADWSPLPSTHRLYYDVLHAGCPGP